MTSLRRADLIGRRRLSENYFFRDFLHSEVAAVFGLCNLPNDVELAVEAGSKLCAELLEPLQKKFGRIHIRSAFRSCEVNAFCNAKKLGCARNEANYADHIWDRRDAAGRMGATACIIVPRFADLFANQGDWTELAWWIHDSLPYHTLYFFPKLWAVNVQWREQPERRIDSYAPWNEDQLKTGTLTKPGMSNHSETHPEYYARLEKAFAQ